MMQYSLLELRARKRLNQKEVARDMKVSPQTYGAWEKDLTNIGFGKVLNLASYFGVSVDEIKATPEDEVVAKNFTPEHDFKSSKSAQDSA